MLHNEVKNKNKHFYNSDAEYIIISSYYSNVLCIFLYFRVKLIIAKKVRIIKDLQKKLDDANSTCEHLEKLLDHQRKEYILKNL